MSWLRIAITWVLAAALTAHLVAATRDVAATEEKAASAEGPFLAAVPERIDRVRLENDKETVTFERRDGRWTVTEPEGIQAPSDTIDAVLDSFTSLPPIEVVSQGVENEGQFGLVPPRVRLRLEQQGELVSTIVLGELSPTRTAVYAKKSGSDDVVLLGLNAKYYLDLVFENVRRQKGSAGADRPPVPAGGPN